MVMSKLFAENKCSIRDVADRFGLGQVTFHRQCERVINFLVHLAPEVIVFPRTAEEKRLIAEEFEKVSGFPDVLGCVDGTSMTIRTPANKIKLTYVNRHDIPSITLQGICDANRHFVDVFTGTPGKIHDSRVFDLSPISKEIPTIFEKKYHLLGDSAYSIREYLLTPYRDYGNLTNEKILFNKKFGLLKGRFRQLSCLEFHCVDKITKFITVCCVLDNLCINRVDFIEEHDNIIHNIVDGVVANETLADVTLRQVSEIKRLFL
ncbi:hypothetical protein RI129_003172 [Pyrocoelia pectoralis]|uniref:DDE Tnp4 domain-containing protein n=1 Tax=Pyrocoelia pectoralis TaxID=417401 RepID=A0AAN7VGI4_9COLE